MPTASAARTISDAEAIRLVREQFAVIETGDEALAEANLTAGYVNHRSVHEPLPAREQGPGR